MTRTLVVAIGVAGLLGCGPEDEAGKTTCPPCPEGHQCIVGTCVPDSSQSPGSSNQGSCSPPMQMCGPSCIDPRSDPLNCGGCGLACGPGATCAMSQCQCTGVAKDCNGMITDGCECPDGCDPVSPQQCKGAASQGQCDPQQQGSCQGEAMYCDSSGGAAKCRSCPAGFTNCDGVAGCECQGACNGAQCGDSGGGGSSGGGSGGGSSGGGGGGGGGSSGMYNVNIVHISISGAKWDTRWGTDPQPDVYALVKVNTPNAPEEKTPVVENTNNVVWSPNLSPILSNISESALKGSGLKIKVRDEDLGGGFGYLYETLGECVFKMDSAMSGTHSKAQPCGQHVDTIEIKFTEI